VLSASFSARGGIHNSGSTEFYGYSSSSIMWDLNSYGKAIRWGVPNRNEKINSEKESWWEINCSEIKRVSH